MRTSVTTPALLPDTHEVTQDRRDAMIRSTRNAQRLVLQAGILLAIALALARC